MAIEIDEGIGPYGKWTREGDILYYYDKSGTMTHLRVREIQEEALRIIREHPGGIRYNELVREIHRRHPETPYNSIPGSINPVGRTIMTEYVTKPARGVFVPIEERAREGRGEAEVTLREEDIYKPLAEYITGGVEDLTEALDFGGSWAGAKWGTPDVVGVYRPRSTDFYTWEPEILAAEVKVDPRQSVVGFGQAVSYRLFATKSYLAMPSTVDDGERGELIARCMQFGIGLILFEPVAESVEFQIEVRAQRGPVDVYHANRFVERLRRHDIEKFRRLFG